MSKKFELTTDTKTWIGRKLFRIRALISFGDVKEGELGGYIEKEENLDHNGNAWVYGNALVCGNAQVYGNAQVSDNARVSGNAWVSDNAWVYDNARVSDNAWVSDDALVSGDARVFGDARVSDNARVSDDADYTTIKGFGTEFRTTTFFRCKGGSIGVRCGCFYGNLDQFRDQVKRTREGKIAEEYLMIAGLMEKHFKEEQKNGNDL